MKNISPSKNEHQWPRCAVKTVETRKRDLVIRIADWGRDREEPSFDVECYIGGFYDWNESEAFTFHPKYGQHKTKAEAKRAAIAFAQSKIAKLL